MSKLHDIFASDFKKLSGENAYDAIKADLEGITIAQYHENQRIQARKERNEYELFPNEKHVSLTRWLKFCNMFGSQGWVGGKKGVYVGWDWNVGKCKNCGSTYPCSVVGTAKSGFESGPLLRCDKCGSYRDQTYWHGSDY